MEVSTLHSCKRTSSGTCLSLGHATSLHSCEARRSYHQPCATNSWGNSIKYRVPRSPFFVNLRCTAGAAPSLYAAFLAESVEGSNEAAKVSAEKVSSLEQFQDRNVLETCTSAFSFPDENQRVLCLMSDTGGGHRASAQALKDGFETLYGDTYEINVVDLWSSSSPWPLCNMPKSYFFLVKNPWLWRLSFRCSEPEVLHEAIFTGYTAIVGRRFAQAFNVLEPNLIVSVHPLMQHVPLKVLARMKESGSFSASDVPFTTVVTDLTRCHRTWFHRGVDRCFVATQLVAAQAMQHGLSALHLACYGLPIRPAFNAPTRSKTEIRQQLGMDTNSSTVMLIGGGEGMGKLETTADALAQTLGQIFLTKLTSSDQIVIICGRNEKLAQSLSSKSWPLKVAVKGFVNNMAEYMTACDCIITKAGPGTIAEALICGLPILLNGYIPCQEEGNVSFVLENGVGAYSEKPDEIAEIVSSWFDNKNSDIEIMSSKAKSLGRPEATFNIVRDLAGMSFSS